MDPTANLHQQTDIAHEIQTLRDRHDPHDVDELCTLADELATLVLALHAWIVGGGVLPTDWTVARG